MSLITFDFEFESHFKDIGINIDAGFSVANNESTWFYSDGRGSARLDPTHDFATFNYVEGSHRFSAQDKLIAEGELVLHMNKDHSVTLISFIDSHNHEHEDGPDGVIVEYREVKEAKYKHEVPEAKGTPTNPALAYFDCPHGSPRTGTCWGDSIYQEFSFPVQIDGTYIETRQEAYDYVQEATSGEEQRARYDLIKQTTDSYFDDYQEPKGTETNEELPNYSIPPEDSFPSSASQPDSPPPSTPQPDSPPPTNPYYLAPDVLDLLGIQPRDIPDGREKGGININIVNNNNYGDGTIVTGDINQGNTYNIFNIGSINIDMSGLIYDLNKGSDRITGTTDDDVLAVGPGKDKLKGGDGADQFIFSIKEKNNKRSVDQILDFDSDEGDTIILDDERLIGLDKNSEFAVAANNNTVKELSREDADIIYLQSKGKLIYDSNDDKKGLGKQGGVFAVMKGKPEIIEDSIQILKGSADSASDVIAEIENNITPRTTDAEIVAANMV